MKSSKEKSRAKYPDRKYVDDLSLGDLFREFIEFYYKNPNKRIISLDLHTEIRQIPHYNPEFCFNIEDPFDVMHNPGNKSKGMTEKYNGAFKQAFTYLEEGNYEKLFPEATK